MTDSVRYVRFERGKRNACSVPGGSVLYEVLETCMLDRAVERDEDFLKRAVAEGKLRLVPE